MYVKTKTLYKAAAIAVGVAIVAAGFLPVVAIDVPKELTKIQREGNAYHRIDGKAVNLVYLGTDYRIPNAWLPLEKNDTGSCTNTVAIKIKLIRERLPHLKPLAAVYDIRNTNASHTVVVIEHPDGGWWFMNNNTNWVRYYESLEGLPGLQIGTLEYWQMLYGTYEGK